MAEIENLTMYKLKRGDIFNADQAAEALPMVTIFEAMEVITQEINAVAHLMRDEELFPTPEDIKHRAKQAAALIGNDRLYILRELLFIHSRNIKSMEQLLDTVVKDPGEEKRQKLLKHCDQLPGEYLENGWQPIVSHLMSAAADILKDYAEQLRHDASPDGGDE